MALPMVGPAILLDGLLTALFCSARAPGSAILPALDMAARLRDEGATVISGFHSPLERECLRVLLRGRQPIVICLARALEGMRIPAECRPAFHEERILYLSPFTGGPRRPTAETARRRNELVASLAHRAFVPYAAPGGETARIVALLQARGVAFLDPATRRTPARQ
ncbi:MAG TPA: hypothetical protein VLH79_10350 [Chthonomonadales bacterium]|nr:hypothetical protein [Chthonomonadales bacterium]